MKGAVAILILLPWLAIGGGTPEKLSNSKLEISRWASTNVDLLVPGAEALSNKRGFTKIPTKNLLYRVTNLALMSDSDTHRVYIVRGEQTFYARYKSDMISFLCVGGQLSWRGSFVSVPDGGGANEKAIAKLISKFDERTLEKADANLSTVFLSHAAPVPFFTRDSAGGSQPGSPKIVSVDLTGDILRLDLLSEREKYSGSFWVDLKHKEVVKSIVEGQEMDLSTPPFARPKR